MPIHSNNTVNMVTANMLTQNIINSSQNIINSSQNIITDDSDSDEDKEEMTTLPSGITIQKVIHKCDRKTDHSTFEFKTNYTYIEIGNYIKRRFT